MALLTNTSQSIDNSIQVFTNSIHTALDNSSYFRNKISRRQVIPAEIQQEINAKNPIRREWQQTRDPLIKISLNAKINLIIRLIGPSYSAEEKTEIIADSLERQFSTFQGSNLPEITESITKIRGSVLKNPNLFTTPG